MEAVHVLDRGDRANDAPLVHVIWKRQLDEDARHPLVDVQIGYQREQLVLRRVCGELVVDRFDPHLLAGLLLSADVERRGLVLANEHGRQADLPPDGFDVAGHLLAHARGESLPVHERDRHGRGA